MRPEASTYTMKSSMSMDLALFSQKSASCRTLSIFLLILKSDGTSWKRRRDDFRLKLVSKIDAPERNCCSIVSKCDVHCHHCWAVVTIVAHLGSQPVACAEGDWDSPHCVQNSESCSSSLAAVPQQKTCKFRMKSSQCDPKWWSKPDCDPVKWTLT